MPVPAETPRGAQLAAALVEADRVRGSGAEEAEDMSMRESLVVGVYGESSRAEGGVKKRSSFISSSGDIITPIRASGWVVRGSGPIGWNV